MATNAVDPKAARGTRDADKLTKHYCQELWNIERMTRELNARLENMTVYANHVGGINWGHLGTAQEVGDRLRQILEFVGPTQEVK
jgi:uncharacterized protein YciW